MTSRMRSVVVAFLLAMAIVVLGGLRFMALAAARQFSPAVLLVGAVAAALLSARLLVWIRSRKPILSIAPYRQQAG